MWFFNGSCLLSGSDFRISMGQCRITVNSFVQVVIRLFVSISLLNCSMLKCYIVLNRHPLSCNIMFYNKYDKGGL